MAKLFVLFLAAGLLLVACAAPTDASKDAQEPVVYPEIKGGNVRVEYYRFTLIKYDKHIIALHLMPDPRHGWDGITYRWYALSDSTDVFFRPKPKEANSPLNSDVTTGAGETKEDGGIGEIIAGPLTFEWSKSSGKKGWLYLGKAADVVKVYPKQFDRFDQFSGVLDSSLWKRVH